MINLKVTNKLIKKSHRWYKKTGFSLFQRAARHLELKKKEKIFNVIDGLQVDTPQIQFTESAQPRVIWICWFQGLDNAPLLVKRCIESVYKHSGALKIVIITESNFLDYISLPPDIIKKYKSGLIGKAHFSDILRCCLLHKYGGIWLDATMFLTRELSTPFLNLPFCSLRFKNLLSSGSISNGLWTTYFLASEKNGYLIECIMNSLIKYWQKYDVAIDYFLMDYVFLYFFEKDAVARQHILMQPFLGGNRFLLKDNMNNCYSNELIEKFSQDSTGIYKLSYKERYRSSDNGQPTVYSQILDGAFRLKG